MAINPISLNVNQVLPTQSNSTDVKATPYEAQKTFGETLKEAISAVNDKQIQSDQLTTRLVNGDDVDLFEVMVAAQKASVTLNATIEVRNKVIEAYQEIMRMQI